VVEVQGLDQCTRLSGEITVTEQDVAAAQTWAKAAARIQARSRLRVVECYPTAALDPGGVEPGTPIRNRAVLSPGVELMVAYDEQSLRLSYRVRGHGPFRNAGNQWDRLFKTGACVDVMIGADDRADPGRRSPVAGDKRLLISMYTGKPTAVLYDAVVPRASEELHWVAESPTGRVEFDVVRRLNGVEITVNEELDEDDTVVAYTVDVVAPLTALGLELRPGMRLKFDWGLTEADAAGRTVLARRYWANTTTSTLADAPSEARLEPDMWGYLIVRDAADAERALDILDPALDLELEDE
jgi:hypothetical protein